MTWGEEKLFKPKHRKKYWKENEKLNDLWDSPKKCDICVTGVPEEGKGKGGKKGTEKVFEGILAAMLPNLTTNSPWQILEAQLIPRRINTKESILRHIMAKLLKNKDFFKILEAARGDGHTHTARMTANFCQKQWTPEDNVIISPQPWRRISSQNLYIIKFSSLYIRTK